jgi:hypothetical protein
MTQVALNDIEKLEDSLWAAADNLRANSQLTSSEYCMPVLGVIFLWYAANRYNVATQQIAADQANGKMSRRSLVKGDFVKRRALMLPKEARYDELLKLPKGANLGTAPVEAMNAIERDFEPLAGQLPKDYENDLLEGSYESSELFPVFQNRVISSERCLKPLSPRRSSRSEANIGRRITSRFSRKSSGGRTAPSAAGSSCMAPGTFVPPPSSARTDCSKGKCCMSRWSLPIQWPVWPFRFRPRIIM